MSKTWRLTLRCGTDALLETGASDITSSERRTRWIPARTPTVFHATTIRLGAPQRQVVIAGDGQVTLGHMVMKANARKVRRLGKGARRGGFIAGAADAFTLFELFEAKLKTSAS